MFAVLQLKHIKMMKKFLALFAFAGLVSCGTIEEEIMLEADGSGVYEIKTDIIPMTVEMTVTMTKMFAAMDTTNTIDEDSLRAAVLDEVWKDFGDGEIDSIIDITSEVPDSILNKGNNRMYYEKMNVYMRGSREAGHMYMGMQYPFTSDEDLQGFMAFFEKLQQEGNQAEQSNPMSKIGNVRSTVTFKSNKNSWSRATVYHNPMDSEEDLGPMDAMFAKSSYITVVKTKRKIKEVKGNYIKRIDDYQVVFEYNLVEAMSGQINTDFEIIFD